MRKDIFIDNNIAKNFSYPHDSEYKKLLKWLLDYNVEDILNKNNYAHLVVSHKLIAEYNRTSRDAKSNTSIPIILSKLQKDGRLFFVKNEEIISFQNEYLKKNVLKKLKSNKEDHAHIAIVLLSDRKYALTYDNNLTFDLENFPSFTVLVKKRPEEIPYDK